MEKPSGRVTYIVVLEGLCRFSVQELSTRGTYHTARIASLEMTKTGNSLVLDFFFNIFIFLNQKRDFYLLGVSFKLLSGSFGDNLKQSKLDDKIMLDVCTWFVPPKVRNFVVIKGKNNITLLHRNLFLSLTKCKCSKLWLFPCFYYECIDDWSLSTVSI